MCTVAPFAGADDMIKKRTYAEVVVAAPAAVRRYGPDDGAEMDALLRGIDSVVWPPTPAATDVPMPTPELLLAWSRRDNSYLGVRIPATGLAWLNPVDAYGAASPRTPAAQVVRAGPLSYGGDDAGDAVTIKPKTTSPKQPKTKQQYDYDADIDATLRGMEREAMERPSPDYISDRQEGKMMLMDRADLIDKMHAFTTHYGLAPGALHRAVSFVDRFLSAKKINLADKRGLCLLGAAAVFTAAKYEDRSTTLKVTADHVASYARCTTSEATAQERELVAVLGYRLGGPTAYTFIEHFLRHGGQEEEAAVRALAHHLADMALLDYRCVALLPSAVAAAAIFLARKSLQRYRWTATPVPVAGGYALEDLSECVEAIYDMHENMEVWPGCARMMRHWNEITDQFPYFLP